MSLLSFPRELLVQIFGQLDVQTAYACQRVNRLFRNVFQESVELAYALECQIAGVDDNPYCTLPIATRLRMLRDRESAWSSLTSQFMTSGSVPHPAFPMFDMTCGLFVIGLAGQEGGLHGVGGGVQTCPIPTASDEPSWSIFKVNGMIDFATSLAEHDLLAFLVMEKLSPELYELRISLISHSLNSPHPLAQQSVFPVCRTQSPDTVYTSMNVAGENIVLSLEHEDSSELYFFNWQTGKLKAPPFPDVDYADVVFLRHDLVLHPNFRTYSFHVYYVPPSTEGGVVKLIQRFLFPNPFPFNCSTIDARGSPNVTGNDSFPKYASSERPFLDRPQDAIILFTFHRVNREPALSMVVHRKSFIKLLPPQSEWSRMNRPVLLGWKMWGPDIARWIDNDSPADFFTTLPFGQRYILIGPTFTVLDFNPHHLSNVNRESDAQDPKRPKDAMKCHLPYTFRSSTSPPYDQLNSGLFLSETGMASFRWVHEEHHYYTTSYKVFHFG